MSRDKVTIPTIGIVGGMGIEATQEFEKLIRLATKVLGYDGESHIPPAIVDNVLKPDRSKALLEGGESPVTEVLRGCVNVANAGAKVIFLPCNTVHAFLADIQEGSPVPIISLIESTRWYIEKHYRYAEEVGLLATDGSVKSERVYHPVFETGNERIKILTPDDLSQKAVMQAIYDRNGVKEGITRKVPKNTVKEGQHPTDRFISAVKTIRFKERYSTIKKKIFIAGCTEVPLALLQEDMPEDSILIDPMKIVALAAVILCHDKDYIQYCNTTSPEQIKKEILLKLANGAFQERRPITKNDMEGLEQAVAEEYKARSSSSPTKEFSSDGESPDVSEEELSQNGEEKLTELFSKYKNFTVTPGIDQGRSNVLRIKLSPRGANQVLEGPGDVRIIEKYIRKETGLHPHAQSRLHLTGCSVTVADTRPVRSLLEKVTGREIGSEKTR